MGYKSTFLYTEVHFCNKCKILQVSDICCNCSSKIRDNTVKLIKRENESLKNQFWFVYIHDESEINPFVYQNKVGEGNTEPKETGSRNG